MPMPMPVAFYCALPRVLKPEQEQKLAA